METKVFPGYYTSLKEISEFVLSAADRAELTAAAAYAVELAVDEACSNIIEHAYGGEGQGDIQCSVQVSKGALTIILRDRGKSFDPQKVAPPKLDIPLEELKTRGLGLFWMGKLMDELFYKTSPQGENVLTMVKRA